MSSDLGRCRWIGVKRAEEDAFGWVGEDFNGVVVRCEGETFRYGR